MEERLKKINQYFLSRALPMNYERIKSQLEVDGLIFDYSYRSFNRDIQSLKDRLSIRYPSLEEEIGSLLRYSVSKKEYYYSRNDISAFPALSSGELSDLAHSISLNKHLFFDGLGEGLINKLEAIQLENNLNRFQKFTKWPAIQLIKDGNRSGREWLKPLLEAIYSNQLIEIQHLGLKESSRKKTIICLPLMIKEYNNGWYTGWYLIFHEIKAEDTLVRLDINQLMVFALDRITSIQSSLKKIDLRIPSDFNPASFFKNNLGIYPRSNKLKPEQIKLKIKPHSWILNYLEKYPLHQSQEMISENETVFVSFFLEINNELEAFIWENLREFEIISPLSLRIKIIEELKKITSLYES